LRNIIFRDSTIREGIETPLLSLSSNQKLDIVKRISKVGVKEFEILSPNCIKETFEVGAMIKESGLDVTTTGFIFQWNSSDVIKSQLDILKDVVDRFIIVIPGSQVNLKLRNTTKEAVWLDISRMLELLNHYGKEPELGIMGAFQINDDDFSSLFKMYKSSIRKFVFYDTSGRATPEQVKQKVVIGKLIAPNSRVFVHAHDDFGLATINTITGIMNGADGCDTVVNGLGDRSGNAAFEEVLVALEQLYNIKTGIDMRKLFPLCQFIYEIFGCAIPDIKPIVGKNAFCHATDMHIHGIFADATESFEPFNIEEIGGHRTFTFLEEKYCASLPYILRKFNIEVNKENLIEYLKAESRKKGRLTEQDIELIVHNRRSVLDEYENKK